VRGEAGRLEGSRDRAANVATVAAAAFVTAAGFVQLPAPFHGDQALFEVVARALRDGARLYVDIWDNKQPGVFWFFLAGGHLFGFSEIGAHALELLWQTACALLLALALRPLFDRAALAAAVPLATVGAYYCATGSRQMTQVEALIGFPLFCSLWLSRPGRGPWAFFFSGVAAGIVAVFKQVIAPIAVVFWILAVLRARRDQKEPLSSSVRFRLLPAAAGVLAALAAAAAWFAAHDSLGALAWNVFVYPLGALLVAQPAPRIRFFASGFWFLSRCAPWIALAVWGAFRGRRDWLRGDCIGWIAAAVVILGAQRFSLWDYHFLMFVVPVGILAVRGIEAISTRTVVRVALVAAACVPGLILLAPKAAAWVPIAPGFDPEAVAVYQRAQSTYYLDLGRESAFLGEPDALPGPIYVWGDPRILLLSGRRQAVPLCGWAWEDMLDEPIAEAARQLAAAPPPYLYVSADARNVLRRRVPAILDWMKTVYEPLKTGGHGEWLKRAAAPSPP